MTIELRLLMLSLSLAMVQIACSSDESQTRSSNGSGDETASDSGDDSMANPDVAALNAYVTSADMSKISEKSHTLVVDGTVARAMPYTGKGPKYSWLRLTDVTVDGKKQYEIYVLVCKDKCGPFLAPVVEDGAMKAGAKIEVLADARGHYKNGLFDVKSISLQDDISNPGPDAGLADQALVALTEIYKVEQFYFAENNKYQDMKSSSVGSKFTLSAALTADGFLARAVHGSDTFEMDQDEIFSHLGFPNDPPRVLEEPLQHLQALSTLEQAYSADMGKFVAMAKVGGDSDKCSDDKLGFGLSKGECKYGKFVYSVDLTSDGFVAHAVNGDKHFEVKN